MSAWYTAVVLMYSMMKITFWYEVARLEPYSCVITLVSFPVAAIAVGVLQSMRDENPTHGPGGKEMG